MTVFLPPISLSCQYICLYCGQHFPCLDLVVCGVVDKVFSTPFLVFFAFTVDESISSGMGDLWISHVDLEN